MRSPLGIPTSWRAAPPRVERHGRCRTPPSTVAPAAGTAGRERRLGRDPGRMAKVKPAALFLALTQLLLVCEPLIESRKASAAEAPVAVQTLDERLQRTKEARVQVGPEWL